MKNTRCQQVLRAKHLWTIALVAMVANPMNFFSATYLFKNQPIPNCEQRNCKERNFAEGRMHDKENDNCVRESCTQYVILRVLHPPWQIYMTSDKTRTIVWKLNSHLICFGLYLRYPGLYLVCTGVKMRHRLLAGGGGGGGQDTLKYPRYPGGDGKS